MNTSTTTEDRIWAVLSHLSSLAMGMGIVLPIVGWSDQRRKSNYAAFQSLQALGYQSLGFTLWILALLAIVVVVSVIMLAAPQGSGTSLVPWRTIFFRIVLGFIALYLLLPILAGVACALGKDFRYPILGDRLAHYLEYDPNQRSEEQVWLKEDHELRWIAAAGHFSVLILIWGMLAPLTVWLIYGKQNFFLKFQSIQTLVYQAVATVLLFIGMVLYSGGLVALIAFMGGLGQLAINSSLEMFGMGVAVIFLLVAAVVILLIPLLHILGQWAGYCVLKGEDYRYPLVGRLTDKWIEKESRREKST